MGERLGRNRMYLRREGSVAHPYSKENVFFTYFLNDFGSRWFIKVQQHNNMVLGGLEYDLFENDNHLTN